MKTNFRYGCWIIDNVNFSGDAFRKKITFKNQEVEIIVSDYENSQKLETPLKIWISEILNYCMSNITFMNQPTLNKYVIIKIGEDFEDTHGFYNLLNLSLRIHFFGPTCISTLAEFIPEGASIMPKCNKSINMLRANVHTIDSQSMDNVILTFNLLKDLKVKYHYPIEEIFKITEFNDVLIELLALNSFVEGFWHNGKGESSFIRSFNKMLTDDCFPGKSKRQKDKQKRIRKKIEMQNGIIREDDISDMRRILAHGIYKQIENTWSEIQWKTLYKQRDCLFELVFQSLTNKISRENN